MGLIQLGIIAQSFWKINPFFKKISEIFWKGLSSPIFCAGLLRWVFFHKQKKWRKDKMPLNNLCKPPCINTDLWVFMGCLWTNLWTMGKTLLILRSKSIINPHGEGFGLCIRRCINLQKENFIRNYVPVGTAKNAKEISAKSCKLLVWVEKTVSHFHFAEKTLYKSNKNFVPYESGTMGNTFVIKLDTGGTPCRER